MVTVANWASMKNAQSKAFEKALADCVGARVEKYHEDRFFRVGDVAHQLYIGYVPRTSFPRGVVVPKYSFVVSRYGVKPGCWLVHGDDINTAASEFAVIFNG